MSASHNYCGIEGRFKAVKISYCPDVSKYGRKVAWAGRTHLSLKGKIVGKPSTWNDIIVDSTEHNSNVTCTGSRRVYRAQKHGMSAIHSRYFW